VDVLAVSEPIAPLTDRVEAGLEGVKRHAEGTPVELMVRELGLTGPSKLLLNRLRAWRLPDRVRLAIGDDAYEFHLSTGFEYQQFEKYGSSPDGTALTLFSRDIRSDDTVWDVGANVGVYTVVATATCAESQVVAFEPQPSNLARIRENLTLNDRDAILRQVALSDCDGTAHIQVNTPPGEGAFGVLREDTGEGSVEVATSRGDGLIADGLPAPTVLKIDVQGAELAVLRGLADALPDCRVIYVNVYEKHFDREQNVETLYRPLRDAGFDVERVADWDGGHFVRAGR
jgi:FkbM family methyltransferase